MVVAQHRATAARQAALVLTSRPRDGAVPRVEAARRLVDSVVRLVFIWGSFAVRRRGGAGADGPKCCVGRYRNVCAAVSLRYQGWVACGCLRLVMEDDPVMMWSQ